MIDLDTLDFSKGNGLVAVVAQDSGSGQVLMTAFADREALERTISTGEMHYRSRTRGLWHKGATSGNTQRIVSLTVDCDRDAILARVIPAGPACHTGSTTCFGDIPADSLAELDAIIDARAAEPRPSEGVAQGYTRRLLADRNLRLKKIGEESAEFVTACADGDALRATEEAADLLYHTLVALHSAGGSLAGVREALRRRTPGRQSN